MEIYKYEGMVLGSRGYMNNANFEKNLVNDNIVLDMFIICQKLQHSQVFLKILYLYILIYS